METGRKAEFITDITRPPKGNQASNDQSEQHYYLLKDGNCLNIYRQISKTHLSRFFSQPTLTAITPLTHLNSSFLNNNGQTFLL